MGISDHPLAGASDAARGLTIAWLALGCASLGVSAVCAIVLVAARSPYLAGIIPHVNLFGPALVLHVVLSAVIWLLAYAGAFASAASLGQYAALRRWLYSGAAAGVATVIVSPVAGGTALLVNYVPVLDNALFFGGLALFATSLCGTALLTFLERPGDGSRAAVRTLVLWALSPLAAVLMALAWSAATGLPDESPAAYYEALFWGAGHVLQFVHGALMIIAWLALARACGMRVPLTPRAAVALLGIAVAPVLAAPVIHGLYPAGSPAFFRAYTHLMEYGTGLVAIPLAAMLAWSCLRSWRAASSARALLLLSTLLFLSGAVLGLLIRSESALVPAHYHGTIGAVTLAYMGLATHALGVMGRRHESRGGLRWALLYGGGLALVVAGLAWSGFNELPRKMPWAHASGAAAYAAMTLICIGGAAAIAGAGGYAMRTLSGLAAAAQLGILRTRDVRVRAIGATTAAVLIGGIVLGHWGSEADSGASRAVEPDPRLQPREHADARRRAEVAERFHQAVVMLHARQYEHAVTALHRVLELAPRMPEAHVDMGYALIGLQRYGAARDFFEGALALRPAQHNAYYGLAVALEGLDDVAGAVGAMRTYVHLAKPDDAYLRKAQAALWEWDSRLAEQRTALAAAQPRRVSRRDVP